MGKVKVMITNNQTEVKIPVGIRLLVRRCCHADFDMNHETGAFLLGDIVISLETAYRQAEIYGHSLEREIGFLTVHSMLHLLGYDHEESNLQERIMREKEEAILGNLGISRDATFLGEHEHR